jgi:FdhE protein
MSKNDVKISALLQAAKVSPEYEALTPLFSAIYGYLTGREERTGINIDLSKIDGAVRTATCFPLISPTEVTVDRKVFVDFLVGVISVLLQQGKQGAEDLVRISSAVSSGEINPESLLVSILERRRGPLDEAAISINVPSSLLEYIFEIPFKAAMERFAEGIPGDAFPQWQENICPVCGARPAMAELSGDEGRRFLSCSACFYLWPFKRLKCPSCGCEDTEKLSYFMAGDGATRVDTCRACSRYIKTRDSRKGGCDVPLEIEDLITIHLDLLASREGFERGR